MPVADRSTDTEIGSKSVRSAILLRTPGRRRGPKRRPREMRQRMSGGRFWTRTAVRLRAWS
jgi:hypothetical protein